MTERCIRCRRWRPPAFYEAHQGWVCDQCDAEALARFRASGPKPTDDDTTSTTVSAAAWRARQSARIGA